VVVVVALDVAFLAVDFAFVLDVAFLAVDFAFVDAFFVAFVAMVTYLLLLLERKSKGITKYSLFLRS
jgi:hypothetical protein